MHTIIPIIKRHFVGKLVGHVTSFAETVADHTPDYGHIVSDVVFAKAAAKKQLINNPHRDAMCDETLALCRGIAAASAAYKSMGLGEKIEDDIEFSDILADVRATFVEAKGLLTMVLT